MPLPISLIRSACPPVELADLELTLHEVSPHISMYLPISPYISLANLELTLHEARVRVRARVSWGEPLPLPLPLTLTLTLTLTSVRRVCVEATLSCFGLARPPSPPRLPGSPNPNPKPNPHSIPNANPNPNPHRHPGSEDARSRRQAAARRGRAAALPLRR